MNANHLPAQTRIAAVSLTVADLERSLAFYRHYLGFRAESDAGKATLSVGDSPLLMLHELPQARPKPPRATGLYHFALLLPGRRDLARALDRLLALNYPLQGASDHLVSEAVYLADPDGNGIEIYADRPRASWRRADGRLQMGTEPLDFEGLMAELADDDASWPGLPVGTTLGHIHLHVDDLARAERFYVEVLGFDLVARYGPSALFVSAGGYHHHIGLNTWAGVGAPPPPVGTVGLRHYTIEVPGASGRSKLSERLQMAGYPVRADEQGLVVADPAGNVLRIVFS